MIKGYKQSYVKCTKCPNNTEKITTSGFYGAKVCSKCGELIIADSCEDIGKRQRCPVCGNDITIYN